MGFLAELYSPKHWKETLSVLLLLLVFLSEAIYRVPLYSYSLNFIASWQQHFPSPLTGELCKRFSFFGTETALALLLILVYITAPRRLFLKLTMVYYVNQCMNAFSKLFYHDPRPYFSSDSVRAINCTRGYGNPSGHAIAAVSVYGSLWIMTYLEEWKGFSGFHSPRVRAGVKWVSLSAVVVVMGLTFFARMFLGVHSANHVLFGACIGAWIVFAFAVALQQYVDAHLGSSTRDHNQFLISLGGSVVLLAFLLVQIANFAAYFWLRNEPNLLEPEWVARINAKCPGSLTNWDPVSDVFRMILHTTLYPLIYLSQLLSSRWFPRAFEDWTARIGAAKMALRFLVVAALLCICFAPYVLVPADSSFAVSMSVGIVLPNLLSAFGGFLAVDWFCLRLGLVGTPERETEDDKCYCIDIEMQPARIEERTPEYKALTEGISDPSTNA